MELSDEQNIINTTFKIINIQYYKHYVISTSLYFNFNTIIHNAYPCYQ